MAVILFICRDAATQDLFEDNNAEVSSLLQHHPLKLKPANHKAPAAAAAAAAAPPGPPDYVLTLFTSQQPFIIWQIWPLNSYFLENTNCLHALSSLLIQQL